MVGAAGVNLENVASAADTAADDAQHVGHGLHVLEVRDVRDFGYTVGKESRRHDGENGILCTRDFYCLIGALYERRENRNL